MPIFTKDDKNVLFIHIPKSAGSSIEKMAVDAGWAESFSIRGKSLGEIAYCNASFQHLHAEPLSQLFRFEQFDAVFTMVRNPFDRLKSEYYWQRSQSITSLRPQDWVIDTLSRYRRDQFLYDNHIRPQIEFVPDFDCVDIFKLEDIGIDRVSRLFDSLSPRCRPVGSTMLRKALRFKRAKKVEEKKSTKVPEVETEFRECRDKIVNFYRSDFEMFSYEA